VVEGYVQEQAQPRAAENAGLGGLDAAQRTAHFAALGACQHAGNSSQMAEIPAGVEHLNAGGPRPLDESSFGTDSTIDGARCLR
jgi:hypothetical protein